MPRRALRSYPTNYATDLTDEQWAAIAPFVATPSPNGGRPTEIDRRAIVNALLYKNSISLNLDDVYFDECSITIPFVEIGANGTHWRNIFRKHTPLATGAMFGAQRVDDRAAIDFGRAAAVGRRRGDERRDGGPLLIGQIGRILGWRGSKCTSWHTKLLLIRTAWSPS